MRGLSQISIIAAAFTGLLVSGCSERKEPEPVKATPVVEPIVTPPPPPSAREVRDAFETVAKSNAAPLKESPAGNLFYTITGDIALREDPETQAASLKTIHAGSCLKLIDVGQSHQYAKVEVVGQNTHGWMAKRALRPAPKCATP